MSSDHFDGVHLDRRPGRRKCNPEPRTRIRGCGYFIEMTATGANSKSLPEYRSGGGRHHLPGSGKLVKAQARKAKHDRRVRKWQDMIGGAPSLPSPRRSGSGRSDQ